jgi:hypothetical protein
MKIIVEAVLFFYFLRYCNSPQWDKVPTLPYCNSPQWDRVPTLPYCSSPQWDKVPTLPYCNSPQWDKVPTLPYWNRPQWDKLPTKTNINRPHWGKVPTVPYCTSPPVGQGTHITILHQPPVGQGPLIIEDSWSHSDTPHSVDLVWTSGQPVAETSSWQHTALTKDRNPCPPAELEPALPASDRPQTHSLDREATGIFSFFYTTQ